MIRDALLLEAHTPVLDAWPVVGLHSHTAEQPCDDTCTVYNRTGGAA